MSKIKQSVQHSKEPMTLRTLVFGLMMAAAITPLAIFSAVTYKSSADELLRSADKQLVLSAESNVGSITTWLKGNENVVRSLAESEELKSTDPDSLDKSLGKIRSVNPNFYGIAVMDKTGMQIGRSAADGKKVNVGDREYFKKTIAGEPYALQSTISRAIGRYIFAFSSPIYTPGSSSPTGSLGAFAEIRLVTDKITGKKIGETGYSYLIDKKGVIMAHPDLSLTNKPIEKELISKFSSSPKGIPFIAKSQEREVLAVVMDASNDMLLVSQIDKDEINKPLLKMQKILAIMAALTIVLVSTLSWLFAKNISAKIQRLAIIANAMSKASEIERLKQLESILAQVGGVKEIRVLTASILKLSASIKFAIESISKS